MKITDKQTYYAIGDVHGCIGLLRSLLNAIRDDILVTKPLSPVVVFLGDLVDRGPASYEVVDFLMHKWNYDLPFICIQGNHEAMAYAPKLFGEQVTHFDEWLEPRDFFYDGEAVMSYLGHEWELASHLNWFMALPYYVETPNFLFVHAGLPPEMVYDNEEADDDAPQYAFAYSKTRDVEDCDKNDLMWIRGEFLRYDEPHYRYVVHGHTPHQTAPHIFHNRMNLDSGAVWSGRLSCAKLSDFDPVKVTILHTEINHEQDTKIVRREFSLPVNSDQTITFPLMDLNRKLGY